MKKFLIENENIFNKIDSADKAYWLGFLSADGYITKNNQIGLTLSEVDKEHIEKFRKFIGANYEVKTYKPSKTAWSENNYCRLLFTSKTMYKDLVDLGLTTNKTLDLKRPNIDNKYVLDYIRGFIDADGSLTSYLPKNKKSKAYNLKITSQEDILLFILENLNLSHLKIIKYKNKNASYISIGGNKQLDDIMDLIYKDSNYYLDRKYDKYLEFKNSRAG